MNSVQKRFKCEIKNTKKIQIDNRISNKVKDQEWMSIYEKFVKFEIQMV